MTSRRVLVLGGSSGIGLAAALELAARGDRLVLSSRSDEALVAAAARCREAGALDVATVPGDVLRPDDVDRVVAFARDALGGLDAVVTTAQTMAYGRIEDVPREVFDDVVDTAIHGTANVARAVLPLFREQHRGTLVVVNSLLGSITVPAMGVYCTAKWGQRALVRTLQHEVQDERDVHVCMLSPGSINTPIYYQAANYTGLVARPPIPVRQPEVPGRVIADLLDRPRRDVQWRVGPVNPMAIAAYRLFPFVYDRVSRPLFRLVGLTGRPLEPTTGSVEHPVPEHEEIHGRWPDPVGPTR